MKRSRAALDKAQAIIGDSQTYAKRLEMVTLAQDYLESYLAAMAAGKARDYDTAMARWADVDKAIVALNQADPSYLEIKDARHRMRIAREKSLATYFPDRLGFVRSWKVLDAVPNPMRDLDVPDAMFPTDRFVAGMAADGAPVKLNDGTVLQWHDYTSPDGLLDFERATGHVAGEQGDFIGGYAAVVIEVPELTELRFASSSCAPYRFWLNGRELFHLDNWNADYPGQYTVNAYVPAGRSLLMVRFSQLGMSTYATRAGVWFQITQP